MTDKPISDNGCGGKLSAERERRCREILFRTDGDGEYFNVARIFKYADMLARICPRKVCIDVTGTWAEGNSVHLDDGQEATLPPGRLELIQTLVLEQLLPAIHDIHDMTAFFAERIVLSEWSQFGDVPPLNSSVPMSAYHWFRKYVAHPPWSPNVCGYLVKARLLPENFSEHDFYKVAYELASISVELNLDDSDRGYWELTPEGIRQAICAGLLFADDAYRYSAEEYQRMIWGLPSIFDDGDQAELPDSKANIGSDDDVDVGAEPVVDVEPIKATSGKGPDKITGGYYGIGDLIKRNNIPHYRQGAFEKKMRRWRKDNLLSADVIQHDAKTTGKPQYLFRESAGSVQDIIKRYQ